MNPGFGERACTRLLCRPHMYNCVSFPARFHTAEIRYLQGLLWLVCDIAFPDALVRRIPRKYAGIEQEIRDCDGAIEQAVRRQVLSLRNWMSASALCFRLHWHTRHIW